MPTRSLVQKAIDLSNQVKRNRTHFTLRTYKPSRTNTPRTPVNKPKDHVSYTYMTKLGQGLKSINKIKNKRFR